MEDPKDPTAVRLYDVTADNTRMWLDAYVDQSGDLVLGGYDCGDIPKRFFGDAEYEYWLRIPAASKDALLLQLLAEKYGGDQQTSDRFREWLAARDIPFSFESHT